MIVCRVQLMKYLLLVSVSHAKHQNHLLLEMSAENIIVQLEKFSPIKDVSLAKLDLFPPITDVMFVDLVPFKSGINALLAEGTKFLRIILVLSVHNLSLN